MLMMSDTLLPNRISATNRIAEYPLVLIARVMINSDQFNDFSIDAFKTRKFYVSHSMLPRAQSPIQPQSPALRSKVSNRDIP